MNLNIIDKHTFDEANSRCVFSNNNTDRCYALVTEENSSFKFAWRSDLVQVKILMIKPHTYAIGIDENFAIIDFKTGQIILYVFLHFLFHEFKLSSGSLLIATDFEVLIFDIQNCIIKRKIDLPDTYEAMEISTGNVQIKCFGGLSIDEALSVYPIS
jgi:hypothetical protein